MRKSEDRQLKFIKARALEGPFLMEPIDLSNAGTGRAVALQAVEAEVAGFNRVETLEPKEGIAAIRSSRWTSADDNLATEIPGSRISGAGWKAIAAWGGDQRWAEAAGSGVGRLRADSLCRGGIGRYNPVGGFVERSYLPHTGAAFARVLKLASGGSCRATESLGSRLVAGRLEPNEAIIYIAGTRGLHHSGNIQTTSKSAGRIGADEIGLSAEIDDGYVLILPARVLRHGTDIAGAAFDFAAACQRCGRYRQADQQR